MSECIRIIGRKNLIRYYEEHPNVPKSIQTEAAVSGKYGEDIVCYLTAGSALCDKSPTALVLPIIFPKEFTDWPTSPLESIY